MKKEPLRMCIACRAMKPKREMARVVKTASGEISFDRTGKKAGRGAYLCDSEECVKKLKKQKLLNKAFSAPVGDEVYDALEREFFDKK